MYLSESVATMEERWNKNIFLYKSIAFNPKLKYQISKLLVVPFFNDLGIIKLVTDEVKFSGKWNGGGATPWYQTCQSFFLLFLNAISFTFPFPSAHVATPSFCFFSSSSFGFCLHPISIFSSFQWSNKRSRKKESRRERREWEAKLGVGWQEIWWGTPCQKIWKLMFRGYGGCLANAWTLYQRWCTLVKENIQNCPDNVKILQETYGLKVLKMHIW